MHEFKIIQDILPLLEQVARTNQLRVITRVTLEVGALRQLQGEFLQFAFGIATANTVAEEAKLVIKQVPTTVLCKHCKQIFAVQDNIYICSQCGKTSLEVRTGKEVVLASVDGEK